MIRRRSNLHANQDYAIVQESGKKCDTFAFMVLVTVVLLPDDHVSETTRSVIDADTVGEAAVRRAGVHQFGESQLTNASQPLELRCVDKRPRDTICLVPVLISAPTEYDEPVNGVTDALRHHWRRTVPGHMKQMIQTIVCLVKHLLRKQPGVP